MENSFAIALVSCAMTFFILLWMIHYLNKILNIEIPDFIGFLIIIAAVIVLYVKKSFFFEGNPIIWGVTIGAILSLLWNIRFTRFMDFFIRTVISFRFLAWAAVTAVGIYEKSIMMDMWNKYIISSSNPARQYIYIAVIILYILGTVLVLFPNLYSKNSMKNTGFSMYKRVNKPKMITVQFFSLIFVFLCSSLLEEALVIMPSLFK